MAFGWADYLVCLSMLVISVGIGVYYSITGDKQRTTSEFLLASKKANMFAVAFSLMATFMSSITILGVSSEIYTFGTQFIVINVAYAIFTPVAAYLYMPVFFKLKTTSAYEYLERRFGVTTRLVASVAFTLQMVLYMGIVVYAPSLALEAVTGLDHTWAIVIIGIVCTSYAGLGGMKAVLMTDVFQALLMFAAVVTVIGTAVAVTGFSGIFNIAKTHQRLQLWNFNPNPTVRHTWWSLVIGGGFTFLSLYAVNQAQVQRYLSCKNLQTAQKSLFISWPILSALSLSTCFSGLCIFSKYYNCDPLLVGRIKAQDQLMPRYVLDTMGENPGLSGLFVAGIFSGSLSTVSSALNSLSAVTMEDYIKPALKRFKGVTMKDRTETLCSKLLCIVYGGMCVIVAFIAKYLGAILQAALTIFGVVGGPVLGIFTLGMFFPSANEVGSLAGLLIGLCFGFWFGFGGPKPPLPVLPKWTSEEACSEYDDIHVTEFKNSTSPAPSTDYLYVYRMSYQWYIVMSFLISLISGWMFSFLGTRLGYEKATNPDLFVPPVAKYMEKRKQEAENAETGSHNSEAKEKGILPNSKG